MMERLNFSVRISLTAAVVLLSIGSAGCAKKAGNVDVTRAPETTDRQDATEDGPGNDGESGSQGDQALKDVFFDFDAYLLSAEARSRLSGNAAFLKEMSLVRTTIEGHCDERGTIEYNLTLGQRRADAARGYLIDLGVGSGRLMAISYGE